MNTKGNQRFQSVQERIETVFQQLLEEKSLSGITVSEICRRANVHRTTFYGHYVDVYALMEAILKRMYGTVVEAFHTTGENWLENGFLTLFQFVGEHRAFFRAYLAAGAGRAASPILPDKLKDHVLRLMRNAAPEDETAYMYRYTFFMEGLKGTLCFWLDRDCAESPEVLLRVVLSEYVR